MSPQNLRMRHLIMGSLLRTQPTVFRTTTRTRTGLGAVASFAIRTSFLARADEGQVYIFRMDIPAIGATSLVMGLSCVNEDIKRKA